LVVQRFSDQELLCVGGVIEDTGYSAVHQIGFLENSEGSVNLDIFMNFIYYSKFN
jgi:hypothetical protein